MSLLHPSEARQQYPEAWQRIEEEMDVARYGYAATLVPVAAEVITVDGEQMLEVAALTDIPIGEDEDDDGSMTMTFRAKLAA